MGMRSGQGDMIHRHTGCLGYHLTDGVGIMGGELHVVGANEENGIRALTKSAGIGTKGHMGLAHGVVAVKLTGHIAVGRCEIDLCKSCFHV